MTSNASVARTTQDHLSSLPSPPCSVVSCPSCASSSSSESSSPPPPDTPADQTGPSATTAAASPGAAAASAGAHAELSTASRDRRPTGGTVHARVNHLTYRGQAERCLRCLRLVHKKSLADHVKAHRMSGAEGVRVTDDRRCKNCTDKGRECRVARRPCAPGFKTVRCMCCLMYKETCNFRSIYRSIGVSDMESHPATE